MSTTRAAVEGELVGKYRGVMANRYWTLSVLIDGTNPDLNGPIRRAALSLGGTPGLVVVDADVAGFSGWQLERLLDYAGLELLRVLSHQGVFVDVQVDSDMQRLSQIKSQLFAEIASLEQRLNESAAVVLSPMTGRDMPNDPFIPCSTRTPHRRWPYP